MKPRRSRGLKPTPPAREFPLLQEKVDQLCGSRGRGFATDENSPRVSISHCPGYLLVEWRMIRERAKVPVGAGTTTLLLEGLEIISRWPEVEKYRETLAEIRSADRRSLSLAARTALRESIGCSERPGLSIPVSQPCGTTQNLQFRISPKHSTILPAQADEMGMRLSLLGVMAIGAGLRYFGDDRLDPETEEGLDRDELAMRSKCAAKEEVLRGLFEYYLGGREK